MNAELRQQVADTILEHVGFSMHWTKTAADAVLALPLLTEAPSLKSALDRLLPSSGGRVFDGAAEYWTALDLFEALRAGVSQ